MSVIHASGLGSFAGTEGWVAAGIGVCSCWNRVDTPLASVRTFEIRVRVVEKDDTDIPSVVRVDHTGANVDKKLPGETRSRR